MAMMPTLRRKMGTPSLLAAAATLLLHLNAYGAAAQEAPTTGCDSEGELLANLRWVQGACEQAGESFAEADALVPSAVTTRGCAEVVRRVARDCDGLLLRSPVWFAGRKAALDAAVASAAAAVPDDVGQVYHIADPSLQTIHTCGTVLDDGFALFPSIIIGQSRVTIDVGPSRGSLRLEFETLTLDKEHNDNLRLYSAADENEELLLIQHGDLPLMEPILIHASAVHVLFVSDGVNRRTSLRLTVRCVCEDSTSFVDADGDGCVAYATAKHDLCDDPLTADRAARSACPLACEACEVGPCDATPCQNGGTCTEVEPVIPPAGGGHRRQLQGGGYGVGGEVCSSAELSTRSAAVTAECCDEEGEDCSSGAPASCNAGCAAVLVPYYQDCADSLQSFQGGAALVEVIQTAALLCDEAVGLQIPGMVAAGYQCTCADGWSGEDCTISGASPLPDPNTDAFLQAQPEIAAHNWVKCFDSDVDDVSTPAVFHANCDAFDETVLIARNSLGYTFGGYAAQSWSKDTCCEDSANYCGSSYCVYPGAAAGAAFIFNLDPAAAKFGPIDPGGTIGLMGPSGWDPIDASQPVYTGETDYQQASSERWPEFGAHDLSFGFNDLPLSSNEAAMCQQGAVYTGSPNQICGGQYNWGETQLVVWRRMPPTALLPAGFDESYTVSGCHAQSAAYCGTFVHVLARCTSQRYCGTDPTVCARAPVYQLGGPDGPVLYRKDNTGGTEWWVGESSNLESCGDNTFTLYSALSTDPNGPPDCAPCSAEDPRTGDGPPTMPAYSAGNGWTIAGVSMGDISIVAGELSTCCSEWESSGRVPSCRTSGIACGTGNARVDQSTGLEVPTGGAFCTCCVGTVESSVSWCDSHRTGWDANCDRTC
eukprot:COSAG02_NODE_578_length_20075_cov_93.607930_10_plen_879_part_00